MSGGAKAVAKDAVKRGVEVAAALIGRGQMWVVSRRAGPGAVVVLDIDNTIADSWPSFLGERRTQRDRLAVIEPLPFVKAIAHDEPRSAGATVVFLSHRNLWEWPVTYRWLRRHGFAATWWNVVLVPSAAAKVPYLRRLSRRHDVTFWDDLSYGHETGTVTFYAEVIEALAGVSLTYRGWDDIVTLSGKGLERD